MQCEVLLLLPVPLGVLMGVLVMPLGVLVKLVLLMAPMTLRLTSVPSAKHTC